MNDINVDLISNGQGTGQVADKLLNNGRMDVGRMRPFVDNYGRSWMTIYKGGNPKDRASWTTVQINAGATLRRDEWKQLDTAVSEPLRYRLGGVEDLISNGLTYDLGNAMGTTVLEWHDVSDALEAEVTMDAITRSKNDRVVYQHNYLPIPIIHVDYQINARELATSRNMGNPLDTTLAERAARRVAETVENMLFTDTTYSYGEKDSRNRNTIYSYVNYPDRITINKNTPWDHSASTGRTIIDDVLRMKGAAIGSMHYGPWMLYIPTAYDVWLDDDYTGSTPDSAPNTTIRQRLLAIAGIKGIKVIDTLKADNILLVQMTKDVVRLVRGLGIQNIQWAEEGGMVLKMKVMTIQLPQIRSDINGKCGIVHMA